MARFLAGEFGGIRQLARGTGIPYSTLQGLIKGSVKDTRKWGSMLDQIYTARINAITHKELPKTLRTKFREFAKESPYKFTFEMRNWGRVYERIRKQRWKGYLRIHASAVRKMAQGKPLTPQEIMALSWGKGRKARENDTVYLWEMLNDMDRTWGEMWEKYM